MALKLRTLLSQELSDIPGRARAASSAGVSTLVFFFFFAISFRLLWLVVVRLKFGVRDEPVSG